jgi:hypothetical protein
MSGARAARDVNERPYQLHVHVEDAVTHGDRFVPAASLDSVSINLSE